MPKTIIHTFKSRGNAMLQIVRDDGSFSPQQMRGDIQYMLTKTINILASKGIQYGELRKSLTPQSNRQEVALVFDTSNMTETWYGLPIHRRVLPLLHRKSSQNQFGRRRLYCVTPAYTPAISPSTPLALLRSISGLDAGGMKWGGRSLSL